MVAPRRARYPDPMKRTTWLPLVLLVGFTAVSLWLVAPESPLGFLELARRDRWGTQIFLDLVMACSLFLSWLVPDARRHGIVAWPYVVLTLVAGSIGGLAYLVHRGRRRRVIAPA